MTISYIYLHNVAYLSTIRISRHIREGCQKSKWKFKMAFAMKGGGGGLEGVSFAIKLF